jgi:hypothetical protein
MLRKTLNQSAFIFLVSLITLACGNDVDRNLSSINNNQQSNQNSPPPSGNNNNNNNGDDDGGDDFIEPTININFNVGSRVLVGRNMSCSLEAIDPEGRPMSASVSLVVLEDPSDINSNILYQTADQVVDPASGTATFKANRQMAHLSKEGFQVSCLIELVVESDVFRQVSENTTTVLPDRYCLIRKAVNTDDEGIVGRDTYQGYIALPAENSTTHRLCIAEPYL